MKKSPFITGVDIQNGTLGVATVDTSLAKPEIYELNFSPTVSLETGVPLALAVPDDQYTAKVVTVNGDSLEQRNACCRFELSQSILEPQSEFLFDSIPTASAERQLGLIYRRDRTDELLQRLSHYNGGTPSIFRARAIALGLGYVTYCQPVPGKLICLADFADNAVSMVFLYEQRIAAIGFVATHFPTSQPRALAIELKTIVNFRLSSLSEIGITVPLSGLVLSGRPLDQPLLDAIKEFFPSGFSQAVPDFTRFAISPDIPHTSVAQHLVPLGLTVNALA